MRQLANLIWIIPFERRKLVICSAFADAIADAFRSSFEDVVAIETFADSSRSTGSFVHKLSEPAEVSVLLLDARGADTDAAKRLLTALPCRLPSGCWVIVLTGTSILVPDGSILRSLKRVASTVQRWYVEPSISNAASIVPVAIPAVLAWDASSPRTFLRQKIRRLIIHSGLHRYFFKEMILAARIR